MTRIRSAIFRRNQNDSRRSRFSHLRHILKVFMGFLKSSGASEIPTSAWVLPEEHLTVFLKPVQDLSDVLLK